eukprot:1195504-Prorocentrum_minimum.AAC.4
MLFKSNLTGGSATYRDLLRVGGRLGLRELDGGRVDAVALVRECVALALEHMPKVPAAARALDLEATQP